MWWAVDRLNEEEGGGEGQRTVSSSTDAQRYRPSSLAICVDRIILLVFWGL